MKIPAFAKVFTKTPVLSFCLFLVSCFLFLLITPNLTKPALAADCRVNTTISIPRGFTINVGTNGVDTSFSTQLVLNPDANRLGPIKVDSTSGPTAADYDVNVSIGTYNAVVVVGSGAAAYFIPCGGGTDGNGQVIVTPAPTPGPSCNYTYSPTTVSAGGSITVNITGTLGSGTYAAGLANLDHSAVTNPDGSPVRQTNTGSLPVDISLTIPTTVAGGQYLVVAVKDPAPGTLCGGDPDLQLTVTPPSTGCNIVPSNTNWNLQDPVVAGNSVTFNFDDGSGGGAAGQVVIIVEDSTSGAIATNSPALGTPASPTKTWQWNAPNGTYCAAIFFGTAAISRVVNFTVPSAAGDTCSSSALMWVNDLRCRAIGGGWFDSDVFTAGQTALTLESVNFIIWGESSLNKKWNTSITKRTGALAMTGNIVASLYSSPPASGVQYFAQKIRDLNPVQPAFAAAGGIGYQTLGPVQKIWIAFRNMAYVGFIIVFVIMGFMIMFRAHISPQAVATVQDSIPRLVIALILVTFSYAIAGFMIDIMFLVLNIAIQALVSAKLITGADYVFQKNVFQVIWGSWTDIFGSVRSAIGELIDDAIKLPGFFDNLFGWVGGTLSAIVIGIAILFIMFRIFLMLLMAYVMIILLTMFAPFFFLVQALPGNNGAKEWFRQMASNIAVFPTVALMFILAGIMGGIGALAPGSSQAIQPGQIGQFPLIMGNLNAQAIGELIGIGFLLITPSAADIVKNAFGGKGGGGGGGGMGNLGAAALAGAGAGAAVVGAAGRGAGNYIYQRSPIATRMRAGQMLREEKAAEHAELPTFASTQKAHNEDEAAKPKSPRTS